MVIYLLCHMIFIIFSFVSRQKKTFVHQAQSVTDRTRKIIDFIRYIAQLYCDVRGRTVEWNDGKGRAGPSSPAAASVTNDD